MNLLKPIRTDFDSGPLLKILVVDDDHCMLKLYEFVLSSWRLNIEFSLVDNGCDAMRYLEVNSPDILILDLNLNDMDGREVIRFSQEKIQNQSTSIVVVSGMTMINTDNISNILDNVVLMLKPIDLTALLALATEKEAEKRKLDQISRNRT